eukprot:GHVR01120812.1.p1 GENE.GHVR01120812.1~~GHVR01120812.1.p1  ORF type:complete len:316 (-),score=86.52 GHVR01120812.1:302-1225(-)
MGCLCCTSSKLVLTPNCLKKEVHPLVAPPLYRLTSLITIGLNESKDKSIQLGNKLSVVSVYVDGICIDFTSIGDIIDTIRGHTQSSRDIRASLNNGKQDANTAQQRLTELFAVEGVKTVKCFLQLTIPNNYWTTTNCLVAVDTLVHSLSTDREFVTRLFSCECGVIATLLTSIRQYKQEADVKMRGSSNTHSDPSLSYPSSKQALCMLSGWISKLSRKEDQSSHYQKLSDEYNYTEGTSVIEGKEWLPTTPYDTHTHTTSDEWLQLLQLQGVNVSNIIPPVSVYGAVLREATRNNQLKECVCVRVCV